MKQKFVFTSVVAVVTLCISLGIGVVAFAQETASTESQNIEMAQLLIDDTIIGGNLRDFSEVFTNPVRVHSPTGDIYADFPAAVWGQILSGRIGSDEVVTLEHLAVREDIVFAHLKHEASFDNAMLTPAQHTVEPNGEHVAFSRVLIMRFENGRIAEMWDYGNNPIWAVDYADYLPSLTFD